MGTKFNKADSGSVIITGNSEGNITTNATYDSRHKKSNSEETQSAIISKKFTIIAAIIAAIGSIISGFLIAGSNWLTK